MQKIQFQNGKVPVISNADALPVTDCHKIIENLAEQVTSSVLWVDSVNYMINQGVQTFFEFGPKKVLAGMIKKIDRKVKVHSIDTISDIQRVKEVLS